MYVQICARHDICLVVGLFGRFQSNPIPTLDSYKENNTIFARNYGLYADLQTYR